MTETRIRPGEERDLPALVDVYNHYVRTTHITFDTRPSTADERRAWFDAFSLSGPHQLLVADISGDVAGYASSSPLRPKPAYGQSVETTIYLSPDFVGRGIGVQLYGALLELLQTETSLHRAYGGIALPNRASIALHERFDFLPIGTFHEVGYKLGKYWDVAWYEKNL